MNCSNCSVEFKITKRYKNDCLCGKCRGKKKYLENVDSYRKTKKCPECGTVILKTSTFCSRCSQKAERNHRWKHEKQSRRITATIEWKNWENEVKNRDARKCVICGSSYRLAAHHILPKRDYPDKIFDVNNGISLCHNHHSQVQFNEYNYVNKFQSIIMAELKLRELGEPCDGNTEPSQSNLEGVTTRGEINSSTSAGQPLQA